MRICIVSLAASNLYPEMPDRYFGGAEVQTALLAPELVRLGHSVSVITYDFGVPGRTLPSGVTLIPSYPPVAGAKVAALRRLIQALERAAPHAVYQMGVDKSSYVACRWAHRKGIPYILAIGHDDDVRLDLRKRSLLSRWTGKRTLQLADVVIAQTDAQSELLRRLRDVPSLRVPSATEIPKKLPEKQAPYVLWNGRFEPWKRPELFMDLATQFPGPEYHMVGGPARGQERFYQRMQRRAEEVGIHFHGFVRDVTPFFEMARVFIVTSSSEGFPNTLMQAWARGAVVISTLDFDNLLERKKVGLVAPPKELSHKLRAVLEDEQLQKQIRQAAFEYVKGVHRPQDVAQKLEEIIVRAVRTRTPTRWR